MAELVTTNAIVPQYDYVTASTTNQGTAYENMCGQIALFPDVDISTSAVTKNGERMRRCVFVKNGSGGTLAAGAALNWVTSYWGTRVQNCPVGSQVRCFVPAYIRGSISNTIPDGSFFYAVIDGPTSVLSDGTTLAVNDGIVVRAVAGQVGTDYGIGGGAVFSSTAVSTVLTNTVTATKYDQSYTFPANSLKAGDLIRVSGEVSIPSGNSTNTLLTELMLGTTVLGTLTAFDPTDGGGDIVGINAEIEIRTAGASGTLVAFGTFTKNVNGTTTVAEFQKASTAIDTTATQQLAVRGTWSVANASNQSQLDMLTVSRLNTTAPGLRGGICVVASTGTGTAAQFRSQVKCPW